MHVIDALSSDFYEVEFSGQPATMWDVFQDWNAHDRLGLLIYEPLAGIGATHLIQMACMCFYDVKPIRRTERKIYPEIFAIQVGDWWGGHGNFDFWPPRREVRVANDHRDVLGAINDRGITRLAMPERPQRDIAHRRKEEDCALDRLVTAIMYSSTGRVSNPDFTIRSNNRRSERDVQRVINPAQMSEQSIVQLGKLAVPVKEGDPDFMPRQNELNANVSDRTRTEAETRRTALKENGLITESYRLVSPEVALKCL
ncbi:hypothetical protein B0G71_8009 [Paraburkholderia sp. BL27I4N3]|uniref:hypothetical protein n=1 Tax=Paraburkholderia sp. BL27I4N3 TaxID=1938805 RepID=UPI000E2506BB|nr:hypothetical protein [Paraburkholderia sp. BL27I4N3]REE07496.1 hypothetical protein B0G71_8009 [Paraburkholderia sp. BL27I4N3]